VSDKERQMNKIGETQAGTILVEMSQDEWLKLHQSGSPILAANVIPVDPIVVDRFMFWVFGRRISAAQEDLRLGPLIQQILERERQYHAGWIEVLETKLGLIPPYEPRSRKECAAIFGFDVAGISKIENQLKRRLRHPSRLKEIWKILREYEDSDLE
jgi:hypothetical protein